jgi:ribA/ribD-fused uncharacterized protein
MVRKTINDDLNIDCSNILFTRVHRSPPGPRKIGYDRPIIVKFHYFGHRMDVWGRRRNLKGTIKLAEDFPQEIQKRRQQLKPILNEAKKHEDYKDRSYLNVDKLIINGQVYTVSTLDRLPMVLNPRNISTPTKEGVTCFWGRLSPLSNHYPAPLKIENKVFYTSENYYLYKEALACHDEILAEMIAIERDPAKAKQLAKRLVKVSQPLKDEWNKQCDHVMYEAVLAKFSQNDVLKTFLLGTGDTRIGEASPRDTYWGTGMHLGHKDAFKPSIWTGVNKLGQILQDVRKALC